MSEHEEAPGSGLRAEDADGEAVGGYRTLANAVVERTGYGREEPLGDPVPTPPDEDAARSPVRRHRSSDDGEGRRE